MILYRVASQYSNEAVILSDEHFSKFIGFTGYLDWNGSWSSAAISCTWLHYLQNWLGGTGKCEATDQNYNDQIENKGSNSQWFWFKCHK